jgi:L-2-hydroxyglutarate oxidase LhgO
MVDGVDVAVIGGGVVGCAVAAVLASRGRQVLLLEAQSRLGTEVSSRNSGVIHSGLYYPPGSLKAESCVRGNRLLYQWASERGVWHARTGKLVVAQSPGQEQALDALHDNARRSGAPGLERLGGREAAALEPELSVTAALLCRDTGIVDAHEFVESLAAAARRDGAEIVTGARVTGLARDRGGFRIESERGELRAEQLVNAAGLSADLVARLLGVDRFTLYPCRGDYFRLRTTARYGRLIYPVKDPASPGLGIHLTLERGGGYRLGPDTEYVERRDDYRDREDKRDLFLAAAQRLLGPLRPEQLSYDGCGIRPKLRAPTAPAELDFVVEEDPPGCVQMIGIESPGLTASLDLAERVAALLGAGSGMVRPA